MSKGYPDFPTPQTDPQPGSASSRLNQPAKRFQPDTLLAAKIEAKLWNDRELRSLEAGHLRVEVRQGVARLDGLIAKALNHTRAGEIALAVDGIKGVRNELVIDDVLKGWVATALARDNRTRACVLPVVSSHGWTYLGGKRS